MLGTATPQTVTMRRQHDSILSSAEKKLLVYMARRMPSQLNADHFTLLGVIGGALSGVSCIAANWDIRFLWGACAGLALNWFGDSLDGSLARVRKCERPMYGFYLDQICDVASHYMLLIGMAFSPVMHAWSPLLALLGSMLVMYYQQLKLRFEPVWRVSHLGWGPTETRLVIGFGFAIVVLYGQPTFAINGEKITVFDAVAVTVFVATVIGVFMSFIEDSGQFARREFAVSDRSNDLDRIVTGLSYEERSKTREIIGDVRPARVVR